MSLAAPIWLFALLPWAGVVLYLIWGRRRRVDVPFLELWPAHGEGVRVRRRASPPPIALALAILGTLLAILATGRPQVRTRWSGASEVSIIIDRGYTMSARGDGAVTRTLETRSAFQGPGHLRIIPDGDDVGTPTALDTRDAVRAAIHQSLAEIAAGPVVVMSDQPLGFADDRLIQVLPSKPVSNARIIMMSARETPTPQAMIRLRGRVGTGVAMLRVSSGDVANEKSVTLPSDGERDEFIDLPKFGKTIKAELLVTDDQPADDMAWLVREASWPRVQARAPVPPAVQRMIEVYSRERPASDASRDVAVVTSVDQLPTNQPGVVIASVDSPRQIEKPVVADHPITRHVEFSDVGAVATSRDQPPVGWTPIVSASGKVWVAVREQPIRGVWVGFDSDSWTRSTAFVVFWTNVLDWAGGQGGERFASYPVGSLDDVNEWTPIELAGSLAPPQKGLWPGLYRRADGTLRALNAPDVPFPVLKETDWRERLARLTNESKSRSDVSPMLALAALVCVGLAAATWKRRQAVRG